MTLQEISILYCQLKKEIDNGTAEDPQFNCEWMNALKNSLEKKYRK